METTTSFLEKILNTDGSLSRLMSNTSYLQKYLTPAEIHELSSWAGRTLFEKIYLIVSGHNAIPVCECGKTFKFISYKQGYKCSCGKRLSLRKRYKRIKKSNTNPPTNEEKKHKKSPLYRYKDGKEFWTAKALSSYIYKIDNNQCPESPDIALQYVRKQYGGKYLSQYRIKVGSDFKRGFIEFTSFEDMFRYRNSNRRIHFKCSKCNHDVYATYFVLTHFHDLLCKHCRKEQH